MGNKDRGGREGSGCSCQRRRCKIMDFRLISLDLLRFNYSPPHPHPPSQLSSPDRKSFCTQSNSRDLLTLHLSSGPDMTFRCCQVRAELWDDNTAITAPTSRLLETIFLFVLPVIPDRQSLLMTSSSYSRVLLVTQNLI